MPVEHQLSNEHINTLRESKTKNYLIVERYEDEGDEWKKSKNYECSVCDFMNHEHGHRLTIQTV